MRQSWRHGPARAARQSTQTLHALLCPTPPAPHSVPPHRLAGLEQPQLQRCGVVQLWQAAGFACLAARRRNRLEPWPGYIQQGCCAACERLCMLLATLQRLRSKQSAHERRGCLSNAADASMAGRPGSRNRSTNMPAAWQPLRAEGAQALGEQQQGCASSSRSRGSPGSREPLQAPKPWELQTCTHTCCRSAARCSAATACCCRGPPAGPPLAAAYASSASREASTAASSCGRSRSACRAAAA